MNHQHEYFLLQHAQQVLRERWSLAERHAHRSRRPVLLPWRTRTAGVLGRLARVLAAIAEDLDPKTSTRPLRG
jgi:hypothetical protein